MHRRQPDAWKFSRHRGFTMVELLVVIGIIALLVTISVAAIAPLLGNAKVAATKTTLNQLGRMVDERIQSLLESDRVETQSKNIKKGFDASRSPGVAPMPQTVADSIAKMHVYRSFFPQRKEDMYGLDGIPDTNDDSPLLTAMRSGGNWIPDSWGARNEAKYDSVLSPAAESSELLYLFLSQGGAGGISSSLNVDQINPKHIGDTDNDGNLEFVDAWGHPLQFFNWPTELFQNAAAVKSQVTANTSSFQNTDPFDSTGSISRFAAVSSSFNSSNVLGLKTPDKYWAFMIISGGPDESTGLHPAGDRGATDLQRLGQPTSLDAIYDNITNRQQ
ncbi:type II secretion system protein [Planctomicrobium sp. SH661]|uniref:type II secretion system protein n=1 Tax=Planctomicrobium sp. SH661 TaxID=3448124 RepID=UPI003F5C766C